jgi:soluble lytic murein transglycosylase-like protein
MRGIGFLPRSAARAILAGALLAGGGFRPAPARSAEHGTPPVETAMVMPRLHAPAGGTPLGLPQPLPPSDAALVRDIFARQRHGDISGAEAETAKLTDQTLLGDILADRILARPLGTPLSTIVNWLQRYPDLPDAGAIRALLVKRARPGAAIPAIRAAASLGAAERDVNGIGASPARRAFTAGRDAQAERLGRAAWLRSHGRDGASAYVAGLAAWRSGHVADAVTLFEAASTAPASGAGLRAAGAYWAARAHQRVGDAAAWLPWMRRAAAEPHVLHGMLARRALGLPEPAAPRQGVLTEADFDALSSRPAGRRAFALLQVNERARAEAALRQLWPQAQASPAVARALMLVAEAAALTNLQDDLASALHLAGAEPALPHLRPRGGYTLNPALVYAVARVESAFTPGALSAAGAEGLMQLKPEAAALVAGKSSTALMDPGINLRLGQRFLAYLSREDIAGDNLIRVLVAYNAGPSAAQRLGALTGDPLLFLETLPCDETRHYVQAALTYMGTYASRLRAASPALDALAAGAWPSFRAEVVQ